MRCVLLAILPSASNIIGIVLLTSYCATSRCCSCHYESCANHFPNLTIILAASYSLSSLPHLTRSHSHHILLAIVLAASTLIYIILVTVYSTTSRCLCHSDSCANKSQSSPSYSPRPTRYYPCHVLLALIVATSYSLLSSPRRPHRHSPHSQRAHCDVSYLPTFHCFRHAEQCYVCQNSVTACDDRGDGCDAGCFCWKREVCSSIYRCTYHRYKE